MLAFVFIASVVWLLFDMAALRLSFTEPNSRQILNELQIKDRELATRRQLPPVLALSQPLKNNQPQSKDPEKKVLQAYRRAKQKKPSSKQPEKHMQSKSPEQVDTLEKQKNSRHFKGPTKVFKKKEAQNGTRAPLVGQEESRVFKSSSNLTKAGPHAVTVIQSLNLSLKSNSSTHKTVQHKVNPTQAPKLPTKVIRGEDERVNQSHSLQDVVNPAQIKLTQLNSTALTKSAKFHKVRNLDVTLKPRDANAPGQFGRAAELAMELQAESRRRWSEGYFNVLLSEQIPVDRVIPDTRPPTCSEKLVPDALPTTTVIFCFVDEVWSTLLRSVHSVLNRSPPHLLTEILLVDDCSSKEYLKDKLDAYMSQFPKVRIIRLKERHGLIRARLAGAAQAKGDVLTFLDSHIECNVGWLEPLLERVYLDRRKVACPVIEVINDKDMSYVLVDNFQRGIFKWPLVFGWSTLSREYIQKNHLKISDPIRCPVMAGGLFSIEKNYFYELGAYDPGLDVWGGENMEISFKIWMCGGEIEIIPCSRVGHIFRGENPYGFPKDRQKTVERNLARVAEVWLDEYKEVFYGHGYLHLLDKNVVDIGNLTEQIQLRKKLQCKSFKWYLQNVYPELDAPPVKAAGPVLNMGVRKCLALVKGVLSFEICDISKQNQDFNYTWVKTLRQNTSCISPDITTKRVASEPCDNTHHHWLHKVHHSLADHLIVENSRLCLEADPKANGVHLNTCEASSPHQKWQFTNYYIQ